MIWITSDLHLGHAGIIKLSNRPFADVNEMNSIIIDNINSVVHPNHTLIIAGDFAYGNFTKIQTFRNLIRCQNILFVVGNHDKKNLSKTQINKLFAPNVFDILEHKWYTRHYVVCHYPMLSWNRMNRGAIQLYGHCHDNCWDQEHPRRIHVGVDTNNYKPILMENLI